MAANLYQKGTASTLWQIQKKAELVLNRFLSYLQSFLAQVLEGLVTVGFIDSTTGKDYSSMVMGRDGPQEP